MTRSLIPIRILIICIHGLVIALTSSCYVYDSAELMCDVDESYLATASRIEVSVSTGVIRPLVGSKGKFMTFACDSSNTNWSDVVSLTADLISDLCGGGSDVLGNVTSLRWEQVSSDSQKWASDQIAGDNVRIYLKIRSSQCPEYWIQVSTMYFEVRGLCINPPNYFGVSPVSNSEYRGFLRYADTQYFKTQRAYIRVLYFAEQLAQATSVDFPSELRAELYGYAKIDSSTRELDEYIRSKRK